MKLVYVVILQLLIFLGFAQDVEVLTISSFKHDYLVSEMQYMEDINDTSKTQFIARVKVSGAHQNRMIGQWLNLLSMNAKKLGANLFYVESYVENETTADLIVKMYFGGLNFIKTNKTKVNKNTIYIFNQSRSKSDTAYFYLNQTKKEFDPRKYCVIETKPFQLYNISINGKKATAVNESFPKDAASVFYIIPNNKNNIVTTNSPVMRKNGLSIYFKKNKPLECTYTFGRFAIEIYK
jgi:hypothetical protein